MVVYLSTEKKFSYHPGLNKNASKNRDSSEESFYQRLNKKKERPRGEGERKAQGEQLVKEKSHKQGG